MNRTSFILLFMCILPSVVWGQTPSGSEFQVNSYTTGPQDRASVAADASGNFVVVWRSYSEILGQRYDRGGNPLGGEFQVNSTTAGNGYQPNVAMAQDGSFVVAWFHSYVSSVFGQRFASNGNPVGGEFQVNSYTLYIAPRPRVAANSSADFVVVWSNYFVDGSYRGISARRFSNGAPVGSEFVVNTYTTSIQAGPSVAMDPAGNFVVTWFSDQSGNGDVFGQRFDSTGAPVGGEFQVNSFTTGSQTFNSVAMDDNGNFVVTWSSPPPSGGNLSIFGQRFGSDGSPQGGEFQVNTYAFGNQRFSEVSSDADGDFVVAWSSFGQDGSGYSIFGQQFSSDGTPQGTEFQANTYTTGVQVYPFVAAGADGDFVVVWNDYSGQDGSYSGIFGQRFKGPGFTGNAPTLGLTVSPFNQTSFTTGNTLTVGVSVNNPGNATTDEAFVEELLTAVDFYFGALLPDGNTIVFVTDLATFSTGVGSVSDLSTL